MIDSAPDRQPSPKRLRLDESELPEVVVLSDATVVSTEVTRDECWIHLSFTWSGKSFNLDIAESDRVYDLKIALRELTNVPEERQKVLGLVKGKLPADQERIGNLKLVSGKKFSLVGTPQGDEIKDPSELEFLPDVVNDLDFDFTADPAAAIAYLNDQRNLRKVREFSKKLQLNIIHPIRQGKRLLVLDIDYTILDTKPLTSGALPPAECARPGLHDFLELIYPHYDICIWSQTSWVWIETKLAELEMVGSDKNYKISFVLDKTSMFPVFSQRAGKEYTHSVKALQIIWNHLPQFSAKNTIHVDDLGRNFALNPGEGLKIYAFKGAHTIQAREDRELGRVGRYLVHIAQNTEDFTAIDHKVNSYLNSRLEELLLGCLLLLSQGLEECRSHSTPVTPMKSERIFDVTILLYTGCVTQLLVLVN